MAKATQAERIETDEDYIHCPKMKNSLRELTKKHPDGIADEYIARVLQIPVSRVEEIYRTAVSKLRSIMGV